MIVSSSLSSRPPGGSVPVALVGCASYEDGARVESWVVTPRTPHLHHCHGGLGVSTACGYARRRRPPGGSRGDPGRTRGPLGGCSRPQPSTGLGDDGGDGEMDEGRRQGAAAQATVRCIQSQSKRVQSCCYLEGPAATAGGEARDSPSGRRRIPCASTATSREPDVLLPDSPP